MEPNWIYRFDRFSLDLKNRILVKDREPIRLTPKAFDVLVQLVRAHGEVVTKDQLLETVWPDSNVTESNIFHAISLLRKALAEGNGDRLDQYIANVSGTGYKLVARVTKARAVAHTVSLRRSPAHNTNLTAQPEHRAPQLNRSNGAGHRPQGTATDDNDADPATA